MTRRRVALMIAALALACLAPQLRPARAQRPSEGRQDDKASLWMKHKLDASQKILEGMTRGDYSLIEKSAQGMQTMSYLEGWIRANTPDYQAQLHAFEHATGSLVEAAQKKNLDRATLAYTQLTISCVQCHAIVRDHAKN